MLTHLTFRNAALVDEDADDYNPGGEKLARLIAPALSAHGFEADEPLQEDWGWMIEVEHPVFHLWIGCHVGLEHEDDHLCFIKPDTPTIRRWFTKIDTTATIEPLKAALEAIVRSAQGTTDVAWRSKDEI